MTDRKSCPAQMSKNLLTTESPDGPTPKIPPSSPLLAQLRLDCGVHFAPSLCSLSEAALLIRSCPGSLSASSSMKQSWLLPGGTK